MDYSKVLFFNVIIFGTHSANMFFYILQNNPIFFHLETFLFFLLVTEIIEWKREKAACVSFSFTHTLTKIQSVVWA